MAPKSISIKNILSGNAESPKEDDTQPEQDKNDENISSYDDTITEGGVVEEVTNSFSQEELVKVWHNFIDSNLADKPRYATLLKNYTPTLNDDFVVQVQFETAFQQELFKEIKHDLNFFLRKNLDNTLISINDEVVEQDSPKNKLYTVDDKFKFLSEKNPSLVKLKQQLNLDFD
ncbi:MAG TPA: hypothetical protein PLM76_00760 [Tenuifilaceae bacterium]|nr:hypothetical protein [Tenuifilaceae bacterium]